MCSSVLACNSRTMKSTCSVGASRTTTPCLSVGKVWSLFHTTALGSATLAASKMPSQCGGNRAVLFQICVFPACNEIPAHVHNWCPNSRCDVVQDSHQTLCGLRFQLLCSIYRARIVCVTNDSSKSDGYHLKTTRMRRASSRRSICLTPKSQWKMHRNC